MYPCRREIRQSEDDNCPALQLFGAGRTRNGSMSIPALYDGGVAHSRTPVHALPVRRALRAVCRRRFLSRRDRTSLSGGRMFRLFPSRLFEGRHWPVDRGTEAQDSQGEGGMAEPQHPPRTISRCWSADGASAKNYAADPPPRRLLALYPASAGCCRRDPVGQDDAFAICVGASVASAVMYPTDARWCACLICGSCEANERFPFSGPIGLRASGPALGPRMADLAGACRRAADGVRWNHYAASATPPRLADSSD